MKAKANKKRKVFIGLGILALLLVATYFLAINITQITGKTISNNDGDLNSCLISKQVIFYGAEECVKCIEQKEILRDYLSSLKYVDCGVDYSACAHLEEVPAWEVGSQVITGVVDVSGLKNFAGC
ncbi:MAG: hypothetical protein Q8Q31_04605 [Nanoarchaeota archaeon]|nr:hypothetical protein [Nanoarchaeota archaeon]